jgi:predicted nucleic acid-binding protein
MAEDQDQVVLSDSSPLIGLAAAEVFDVLRRLFGQISVTESVRKEVTAHKHLPGAAELSRGVRDGWIRRLRDPRGGVSLPTLDAGEATTLYAAVRLGRKCLVLMDDAAARAEARALGVTVTGTAGVLLLAHRRRLIRSVRPLIEKLFAARFRISPGVINAILQEAGEG